MATHLQSLQMRVLAKISAILASTHICQTANVALKLWVEFSQYDENRYSCKLSLVSMTKIGICIKASLLHFGKFGEFCKFGKLSKCKPDHLKHIK
jgi:hypothetical protein